jgi:hypothetical protein
MSKKCNDWDASAFCQNEHGKGHFTPSFTRASIIANELFSGGTKYGHDRPTLELSSWKTNYATFDMFTGSRFDVEKFKQTPN